MKLKNTKTPQIASTKQEVLGIILNSISTALSGKDYPQEEEYTIDQLNRYIAKHNLPKYIEYKELGKYMIKHFNKTLQAGEFKRKFISVFVKFSGNYYLKT